MRRISFYKFILVGLFLILSASNTLAGNKTVPLIKAEVLEPISPKEDISQSCSLGCALGWKVSASSTLKSQRGSHYGVKYIDDGLIRTAWVEGAKDYGVCEYITFNFPKSKWVYISGDKINFNGFRVVNGYLKNPRTWKQNSRVKIMRIYLQEVPLYDVLLDDSMTLQEVRFDSVYIKPNDAVKVEIRDVYKGSRFSDTAISELVPMGAH
jgi:hypothetical protein